MKQLRNMLGIVFSGSVIIVSDVERRGEGFSVRKTAQYRLPSGVTLETIAGEAASFKAFLKENGLKSKKAIVGIPARYTLMTQLQIPPIKDSQVRYDTVRMNLERKMEVELSEISFDYADHAVKLDESFLVMMALKKILNQIKDLLHAARVEPVQVINTSLGLDLVKSKGTACNIVEYSDCLELCLFRDGVLKAVQYLSKTADQTVDSELSQKIVRQVDRMLWTSGGKSDHITYYFWGREHPADSERDSMQKVFGDFQFKSLSVTSDDQLADITSELAGGAILGKTIGINFLNGRHTEQKPAITSQGIWKIGAGVAIVFILIAAFIISWRSDRNQIVFLKDQLSSMQENVDSANEMIDQVGYARQWFLQKPEYLELLRELSLAFPEDGDIWLTSFAVDDSFNQILTGRTVREETIMDVIENLQSKTMFDDIKILYIRKMGKGTEVMTFAINLQWLEGK